MHLAQPRSSFAGANCIRGLSEGSGSHVGCFGIHEHAVDRYTTTPQLTDSYFAS